MMKGVKYAVREQNQIVNTANAVNKESAPAWSKPDRELLHQYAMTGVLGNSFYASQTEVVEEAQKLLERCDAPDIAKELIIGRNEGFIRSFPILGLVTLSKKNPELFKEAFPLIIKTGNDLGDFIALCRAQRGMGRAIKSAITAWLDTKVTPYYAQKYRHQLADAARLVRYRGDKDPIWGYIFACYGDRLKTWNQEKLKAALEKYPELNAHAQFISAIAAGKTTEARSILRDYSLDVDSLTACYGKFNAALWRELTKQTPVMRFIKYLDKFAREGAFNQGIQVVQEKITVDNLQKAKVFPFRLYTAYSALSVNPRSDNTLNVIRDYLAGVLDDYVTQYDWDVFNQYSWCVCPDVSGSMQSCCGNGTLTYEDIAGMFAAMFRKGLTNASVIPWSHQTFAMPGNKHDSIVSQIAGLKALDGGTDMSCAMREATRNNLKRDVFLFITDSEEYGTRRHAVSGAWIDSWRDYRRKVNPRAEAFLIRVDPYTTNPFPEDVAGKLGVHPIYGWNDSVIKFIEYVVKERSTREAQNKR